jgi:Predicted membrane protein (DUF2142)
MPASYYSEKWNIRYARRALLGGFALIAVAIALTLSRSPPVVAHANGIVPAEGLATISGGATICQAGEALPARTAAVRASLFALIGPRVTLTVTSGAHVLATGAEGSGWTAGAVSIPLEGAGYAASNVKVCMTFGASARSLSMGGRRTGKAVAATIRGRSSAGRLRLEYLRAGDSSWWSMLLGVARRMGLGHAAAGTWIVLLLLAAMLAAGTLAAWVVLGAPSLVNGGSAGGLGTDGEVDPAARTVPRRRSSSRQGSVPRRTVGRAGAVRRSVAHQIVGPTGAARVGVVQQTARRSGATRQGAAQRGIVRQAAAHVGVARRGLVHGARRAADAIPRAAWACALVAFLNAFCWSFLTPPFQVPDEVDHYAYVQQLATTGSLPTSSEESYSAQEQQALQDLRYYDVRESPEGRTIASRAQEARLERDLALPLSQTNNHGAAGVAASEPPLYYALQTIPYLVGGGNLLDRLERMRLSSALLAAVAVLFVFLFLREALPRAPWAWAIGALSVALAPLLGFIGGGVNPDSMLAAVAAALFYCLARGFRRGLSPRLAVALGATIAVGFLTKLNFVGLVPGALLGVGLLAARQARGSNRLALRSMAVALAIGASPVVLYVLHNLLAGHPLLGDVSKAVASLQGSVPHAISYVWQFYLPRLPGMHDYFPAISTTRQIWFDRLIGLYGWLDTVFPGWVYTLALIPACLIAALCARALVLERDALRSRLAELLVYGAMLVGLLVLVGVDSYTNSFKPIGELYAEPRYLLPLAALAGAALALAVRGAGRRWAAAAGALIVVAVLAHDIFSQLLVISRYYG